MGFNEDFDQLILSESHGGPTGTIVALCIHDAEAPERNDTAENVAYYLQPLSRQASVTGCIDNNSKVGTVPYGTTAWHTGAGSPWNGAIEGYEHGGYASQSHDEWFDQYSKDMIEISAAHYAKRCHDLGIPPRHISPDQLKHAVLVSRNPADGGICTHYDITVAAGVYGGHTDPGPNFPMDYYIERLQHYYGGAAPTPSPTPAPEEIDVPTIIRIKTKSGEYLYDPCAGTARNISGDESAVLQAKPFNLSKFEFDAGSAMHRILNGDGTTITKIGYTTVG